MKQGLPLLLQILLILSISTPALSFQPYNTATNSRRHQRCSTLSLQQHYHQAMYFRRPKGNSQQLQHLLLTPTSRDARRGSTKSINRNAPIYSSSSNNDNDNSVDEEPFKVSVNGKIELNGGNVTGTNDKDISLLPNMRDNVTTISTSTSTATTSADNYFATRDGDSDSEKTAIVSPLFTTSTTSSNNVEDILLDPSASVASTLLMNNQTRASMVLEKSLLDLSQAALIGIITGFAVAVFKLSIDALRIFLYLEQPILDKYPWLVALVPALGGIAVGFTRSIGGEFPPGLRGAVEQVDQTTRQAARSLASTVTDSLNSLRKSVAAVFTLGSGCSLGPEGPCVELGINVAKNCLAICPQAEHDDPIRWNRLLLACGGAAGVAAGFNAPIGGVFFALEIMQDAFNQADKKLPSDDDNIKKGHLLMATSASIAPILLSSVLSALCARTILGEHLALEVHGMYSLQAPLVELPLYILLGVICGTVSFAFSKLANTSQSLFSGKAGPQGIKNIMTSMPPAIKPVFGGLFCGALGIAFPQILFFGYSILNPLLENNILPTSLLLTLLAAKMLATAVSIGSGLVGGTFAPALFFGAMTGASFHNIMCLSLHAFSSFSGLPIGEIADVPAYALVGAGTALAALFRAPLTASLVMFEVTRDYDVILPLMVSAGVGVVLCDVLEARFKKTSKDSPVSGIRRDQDTVSWGDLSSKAP